MLNIFVFYFVYLVYINNFNNKGLDYVKKSVYDLIDIWKKLN